MRELLFGLILLILYFFHQKKTANLRRQLAASDDRFRLCLETASTAIIGTSEAGFITLVNRQAEQIFGYSRDELLSQPSIVLFPDSQTARRKDGSLFSYTSSVSQVELPQGHTLCVWVTDISEIKRANEELQRSYTELEQFAHVASHDLQEPLRMITGYLQLVERRYSAILDDDGREFINFAVDGAKRMKTLIRGLLEFSRAGTYTTSFRAADVQDIAHHAIDNLKAAIDDSDALITVDTLPAIMTDPVMLTQVFQNLIANAIKFQNELRPAVHISARRQGTEWIFAIRDNGIGIEARYLDRIFRIFERLHTTEEYSGSGIGLAITKKIVERHGGRIWVESQPGTGSTFFFSIAAETALAATAKNGL